MEEIGFIGCFDKKDLLLNIAKVMGALNKRVLIIDATMEQRLKYIVPNIRNNNNTITYISEYCGIDVAVGFMNLMGIARYLNVNQLPYDYILIDTDNVQTMASFMIPRLKRKFFVTSYDQYEVNRSVEIFRYFNQPMELIMLPFTMDPTDAQKKYLFNIIGSNTPVRLTDSGAIFNDFMEDRQATLENQLMKELKLKNYSQAYKSSLEFLITMLLDGAIAQSEIKKVIKKL